MNEVKKKKKNKNKDTTHKHKIRKIRQTKDGEDQTD